MDAVQVEPVVSTKGLSAGREAEITAEIRINTGSVSCTPLIWAAYFCYKEHPMTPHPL